MNFVRVGLVALLMLTGCDKVEHGLDTADQINAKLDKLNGGVGQQSVAIPFEAMLKPEYGTVLTPVPFDIMPFAQKFAENTGADEIIQIVDLWMKKLNQAAPSQENPTPEQLEEFNHQQLQAFSALQAVCGFISDAKVVDIVNKQIYGDGRYREAADAMLMLRVHFLRDVMIGADISPIDTVGKLELANTYANSIDLIARFAFIDEIKFSVIALKPTISEALKPNVASLIWKKIKTGSKRSLKVTAEELTGNPVADQNLERDHQARMDRALAFVDQKIAEWAVQP